MAQKVNVILVDDIDGSDAVETASFGLDGTQYEIDLNSGHAEELRELLDLYVKKARRVTGSAGRGGRGPQDRRKRRQEQGDTQLGQGAAPGCQRARSHPCRHRGAVRGGKRQVGRAPNSPGPVRSAGLLTRVRPADGNPPGISGTRQRIPFYTATRRPGRRAESLAPPPGFSRLRIMPTISAPGSCGNARHPREGR
jgi:hypothetical protein